MRHLYWSLAEPPIFLRVFLARAFSLLNIRFVKKKQKRGKENTLFRNKRNLYTNFLLFETCKKRKRKWKWKHGNTPDITTKTKNPIMKDISWETLGNNAWRFRTFCTIVSLFRKIRVTRIISTVLLMKKWF